MMLNLTGLCQPVRAQKKRAVAGEVAHKKSVPQCGTQDGKLSGRKVGAARSVRRNAARVKPAPLAKPSYRSFFSRGSPPPFGAGLLWFLGGAS